jgi:hypothetical protein
VARQKAVQPEPNDAPRPRGRPPAEEPGSAVMTWVPLTMHDRLIEIANKNGESLSATIRQLLSQRVR